MFNVPCFFLEMILVDGSRSLCLHFVLIVSELLRWFVISLSGVWCLQRVAIGR